MTCPRIRGLVHVALAPVLARGSAFGNGMLRQLLICAPALAVLAFVSPTRVHGQADIRSMVERYAELTDASPEKAAGLLQLFDVLAAETDREFHDRVRGLPVTVLEWVGRDAQGRDGIWKEFIHQSGRSRIIFRPSDLLRSPSVAQSQTPSGSEGKESDRLESGTPMTRTSPSDGLTNCGSSPNHVQKLPGNACLTLSAKYSGSWNP